MRINFARFARIARIYCLYKKEINAYFFSPTAYLLSAFFIFLMGWIFFHSLLISKENYSVSLTSAIIRPIFGNMNFLFLIVIPLITMRLFTEEKRDHTIDLLLASKLTHLDIILGKFLGGFTVIFFMMLLTMIFPLILAIAGYTDWPVIITTYIGSILNAMCFLSIGIFISSITENQIVCALITFCILIFLLIISQSANVMTNFMLSQIISYFGVSSHLATFTNGTIDLSAFIYYGTFVGFFLFLTHKVLDSRSW
ncbi:MAG: ABC transporter permease subunit [Oligoflexia bacterium]|nr:ABC transporter permease subunit [Oligoflexia bacterium]